MRTYLILFTSLMTLACAPFISSPYSDQLLRPERNLNNRAIQSLGTLDESNGLRFLVFSDSHQNYKELDEVIYKMNQETDVDFKINLGDVTNTSYNFEYDEFLDAVKNLKGPTFYVLGNHDAVGAGYELFKKAFGSANYYFESNTYRFIVFNGNNWERPDLFKPEWLKQTVDSSTKDVIIFIHVPLTDQERFHGSVAATFDTILNDNKVKAVFNGHNHVYGSNQKYNTLLLQCGRVQGQNGVHWLQIDISGGQMCITRKDSGVQECKTLK